MTLAGVTRWLGYPLLRAESTTCCVLSVSPEVCGLEIIPNNRISRKACQRQFCHEGSALINEEGCYCIRRVGAQLDFLFRCVGHSLASPAAGLSLMREGAPC